MELTTSRIRRERQARKKANTIHLQMRNRKRGVTAGALTLALSQRERGLTALINDLSNSANYGFS